MSANYWRTTMDEFGPGVLYDTVNDEVIDANQLNNRSTVAALAGGIQSVIGLGIFYTYTEKLMASLQTAGLGVQVNVPEKQFFLSKLLGNKVHPFFGKFGSNIFKGLDGMSIGVGNMDLGWFGYTKHHKSLFTQIGTYMDDLATRAFGTGANLSQITTKQFQEQIVSKYATVDVNTLSDAFEKQIAENVQSLVKKHGGGEVGQQLAQKSISRTFKFSQAAKIFLNAMHLIQVYQISDLIGSLIRSAIDFNTQVTQQRNEIRYYRRLQGISGQLSQQRPNELSYNRGEDRIIARNMRNSIVLRMMLNDQGIFGSNPYLDYYL